MNRIILSPAGIIVIYLIFLTKQIFALENISTETFFSEIRNIGKSTHAVQLILNSKREKKGEFLLSWRSFHPERNWEEWKWRGSVKKTVNSELELIPKNCTLFSQKNGASRQIPVRTIDCEHYKMTLKKTEGNSAVLSPSLSGEDSAVLLNSETSETACLAVSEEEDRVLGWCSEARYITKSSSARVQKSGLSAEILESIDSTVWFKKTPVIKKGDIIIINIPAYRPEIY
ncbi:MAG TPA: hypothetical protein PL048_03470 [Leptospiraceae bacterium]|nr:hypothetical protein [Leptospiraceae bacterium]HMY68359.1 hypothetical protein [Leptospiraceae bacterium]HMZ57808.1 hypothetical protein [Leptospiraceae bacterium]HNF13428.1 hypothetical protein [Leptospiraceae bacterium]HNF26474.1 hypothetical protein [Leptospiraceae bacterium]